MFMDIHCIQQVPPSNINRDDTGSPKTAYVGGALRSRVSSQAWKRAMRGVFGDMLDSSKLRQNMTISRRSMIVHRKTMPVLP